MIRATKQEFQEMLLWSITTSAVRSGRLTKVNNMTANRLPNDDLKRLLERSNRSSAV